MFYDVPGPEVQAGKGERENPRQSSNYRQPDPDRCPRARCTAPISPPSRPWNLVFGRDSRDFPLLLLPTLPRPTLDPSARLLAAGG